MKETIVTGHVGKDPEVRYAPNGDSFTVFSLAVSSGPKDKRKTDWFEITCNGKNADTANKHVRKGTRLLIKGSPGINVWVSREGKPMGVMRISVTYLELIGAKSEDDAEEESFETNEEENDNQSNTSVASENIPFTE